MKHRRKGLLAETMAAVAVAGLTWGPTTARAQDAGAEPPPVNAGKVSFSAGFDVVTEYWFRGLAQENQGLILQPYLDATFNLLAQEDGPIQSVDAFIGTWHSLHTGPSGTGGGGTLHFELDFYAGIAVGLMDKLSLDLRYLAYTSPSGAFSTTEEIDVGLSFDDSDLLGDFALNPSAIVGFELDGGSDAGANEGIYLGLGIEPSFKLLESEDYPITLSIPVTAGFSLDGDYYESTTGDDTFGYLDVGLVLGMPLSFIPAEYGSWEASAGVHMIYLGDETQNIAGRDFGVTGGDDVEVYGVFGLSMGY